MPRILRIINRLNLGGPTWNAALLTKHLSPEFETMLVSGYIDQNEASSEFLLHEMGIRPVYIHGMYREINPFLDVPAFLRLRKLIAAFQPDIVHTHAAKAGALGRLAAWSCGVPIVVHTFHGHVFHSYFNRAVSALFVRIERYLAKRSHCIVAISDQQKHDLVERFRICPSHKVEVIPLGLDLERFRKGQEAKRMRFRAHHGVADHEVVISIVGRLVPVKNHRLFIEAIYRLTRLTDRALKVFIVGDGALRQTLMQQARQFGLLVGDASGEHRQAMITFTSWVREIDEVYAGSDVVALTSYNEGTPVSLIEAIVAGKPIVSTLVGAVGDLVKDGINGFLIQNFDSDAFAQALCRLVEDATLRHTMGTALTRQIEERYGYWRLIAETGRLYRRLLRQQ